MCVQILVMDCSKVKMKIIATIKFFTRNVLLPVTSLATCILLMLYGYTLNSVNVCLLNQARAGLRLTRAWFLRIASVRKWLYVCICVCVCVFACVPAPEAMND